MDKNFNKFELTFSAAIGTNMLTIPVTIIDTSIKILPPNLPANIPAGICRTM